jgi:histidinol-phosphate aminotransferase
MLEHDLADAIKLASNELPFPPLPAAAAAIAGSIDEGSLYPDHRATALREALAASVGLEPDHVTVGCGSVGLLQQFALTYLDPGDPVVFACPSFEAYPVFAALSAARAAEVPLRRQTTDLDAMADAVDQHTKLVLIANPNNPTGTAVGTEPVEAFLGRVPDDCIVVLDEAYREFVDSADVTDTVPLLDRFPNLVVLRTFSKAHALAALRVGYALGNPEVIAAVDRTLVPFAVNGLGQRAALASLGAHGEMRERVRTVTDERTRVARSLRLLGWSVPDAQANFVWLPAGHDAVGLATELERRGVVTRPFADVGVRVTIGAHVANDRFLDVFDQAARTLDPANWQLPTGELAGRVQHTLDELHLAMHRLDAHAADPAPSGALTDPDAPTGERWDAGQVWAHLGEFGSYWLTELRSIVDARSTTPVPFGRIKTDPHRVASIDKGRHEAVRHHQDLVRRDVHRFAAELSQLTPTDWLRRGHHETLGVMDLWQFLDEFAVGHYHQHADQLDGLHHG